MTQSDPIDDIDEPVLTTEQVQRRVRDWLDRLEALFGGIKVWAAENGWTVNESMLPMLEETMRQYGVAAAVQPSLALASPNGSTVLVKPKALWVIGANGRVDIYSSRGTYVLVDVAEQFEPAQWRLHRLARWSGRPFNPTQLAEMV